MIQLTALRPNLRLAWDLARRDLASKYKRSLIGPAWLVLTPLALMSIYWLVFGRIFGISWKGAHGPYEGAPGFLLPFFVGLSVYLTLSDLVNSSSTLFVSKRTFVVKSPFPIWVLILANLARAGVHAVVLLVLVLALAGLQGRLGVAGIAYAVPMLLLITLFLAALSLVLATFGPFIGDISEAMRLLLRILFYATPVTYPITMVPLRYREWLWLNPLTCMVEVLREPLVFGTPPPAAAVAMLCFWSALLGVGGLWVYGRVHKVISDVV